jgi:hypothetical protein
MTGVFRRKLLGNFVQNFNFNFISFFSFFTLILTTNTALIVRCPSCNCVGSEARSCTSSPRYKREYSRGPMRSGRRAHLLKHGKQSTTSSLRHQAPASQMMTTIHIILFLVPLMSERGLVRALWIKRTSDSSCCMLHSSQFHYEELKSMRLTSFLN